MKRALLLAAALAACGEGTAPGLPGGGGPGSLALDLATVVQGLTSPIYLTAPAGDDRLFVVEQVGRIRVVANGTLRAAPFLDLTQRVRFRDEQGLLSMAFHPAYATNGFFYVSYTDTAGDTRVVRYRVSADPDVADPQSETLVLGLAQPFSNHNGGHILFGPGGYLFIALGDGGGGGDPLGSGQDPSTLLGSLLRIDVDGASPYAVPPDNPFVGDPVARPEIWAYGLRNPWRIAIDPPGGQLYVADVGQSGREEISVVGAAQGGANFGWNVMEGSRCFLQAGCSSAGLTLPAVEYPTSDGCAVVGGFVYRGAAMPDLQGHYLYSDFCAGFLHSFRYTSAGVTEATEWDVPAVGSVLSFGMDAAGELYLLTGSGTVHRIVAREE